MGIVGVSAAKVAQSVVAEGGQRGAETARKDGSLLPRLNRPTA